MKNLLPLLASLEFSGAHTTEHAVHRGWRLINKVWTDAYHPNTYRPRDHSKHSRKKRRK